MIHSCKTTSLIVTIAAIGALVAGCGGIPANHPDLVRARDAYQEAQAKPGIAENAPVEIYDAQQAMQKAEQAENVEDLKHLAYLAERQSQIAIAAASQRAAKKEMEKFSAEKDQLLLDARGAEIESKLRTIEKKESEVERARMEAEKSRAQAEIASARAQELQKELDALNAKMTDRGYVLTLGDVLFEFDRAELLPGAYKTVDQLSIFLEKYPQRSVLIEGYTDSIGSAEYNLELSQRRADAVRMALLQRGITMARIFTKGYGEAYPVASNASEAGRQQNRRVEVVIMEEGVNPASKIR